MNKIKLLISFVLILVVSYFINLQIYASNKTIKVTLETNNGKNYVVDLASNSMDFSYEANFQVLKIYTNNKLVHNISLKNEAITKFTMRYDENYLYGTLIKHLDPYGINNENYFADSQNMIIDFSKADSDDILKIYKGAEQIYEYEMVLGDINLDFTITKIANIAISGSDAIVNNIEEPYTIEKIKEISDLKVTDGYDGDLTSKIIIKEDNYTENKNKVGNYTITFSATNSSKYTVEFILTIINKDLNAPIIEGPLEKSISYTSKTSTEDILKLFTSKDSVDGNLEVFISETNFKENEIGQFNFTFTSKDKSLNESKFDFTLNIIDDIAPKIEDQNIGTIKINYKDNITDQLLLQGLIATDEIDGSITSLLKVVKNDLKPILGTYQVSYEVVDKSGNKANYTRDFEVVSDDKPIFWVSGNIISIEDVNRLTTEQIISLLASYEQILMKDYYVIKDEYRGNENKKGKYLLIVNIKDLFDIDHELERTINVFSSIDKEESKHNNYPLILIISILFLGGLIVTFKQIIKKK